MKGRGAVKYLEIGKSYLIETTWAKGKYILFTSVTEDKNKNLYGFVACVEDNKVVLFNKQGIEKSRNTLFTEKESNDLTNWVEKYNGQTVYFEPDPYQGIGQNITVIP